MWICDADSDVGAGSDSDSDADADADAGVPFGGTRRPTESTFRADLEANEDEHDLEHPLVHDEGQ
eukprot:347046-Rhodomonas_salina.1